MGFGISHMQSGVYIFAQTQIMFGAARPYGGSCAQTTQMLYVI